MACAANFAFVNRQMITHWVRETFEQVFQLGPRDLGLRVIYDVCHNMAKMETHEVQGRKSVSASTEREPPGRFLQAIRRSPRTIRKLGSRFSFRDMGRCLMSGWHAAGYEETFGSACHGAGGHEQTSGDQGGQGRAIARELEDRGIIVEAPAKPPWWRRCRMPTRT